MSESSHTLQVRLPPFEREGVLGLPEGKPRGIVLFAHGSGSSHGSPRNMFVAEALRDAGFAFLLFDLLTIAEAEDRANVFDISLLASRLNKAASWLETNLPGWPMPLGYFGASTGAAAALVGAAARRDVRAVVSRGGRPDLAGDALGAVKSATLLIVGGDDTEVLALNRAASRQMRCERRVAVVPEATHLFEEPGALEQVVALAREWFLRHLGPPGA